MQLTELLRLQLLLSVAIMASCSGAYTQARSLPNGPIVAGYANWNQCDDKLVDAVANGVNVLIWFSINLAVNNTEPAITNGPDWSCVPAIVGKIRERGLQVTHLISIGGWNSPHPSMVLSGPAWFEFWKKWNAEVVARPKEGWHGFDGFDWDIEGNDDFDSPHNTFTLGVLDLMGEMSIAAKKDGFVVTMAPSQSYLDSSSQEFTLSVSLPPAVPWHKDFFYHGRNTYAYLLAQYGSYDSGNPTFDLVSLQLYEGWSGANFAISHEHQKPSAVMADLVRRLIAGFEVDFTDIVPSLGKRRIAVNREQIVVGLANAWTSLPPTKFLFVPPSELQDAYNDLSTTGHQPRGFMFWNIKDEGLPVVPAGEDLGSADPPLDGGLYLAKALNSILATRPLLCVGPDSGACSESSTCCCSVSVSR